MKKIIVFLLALLGGMTAQAADISVLNADLPNEGFNDTTAFIAVGGNNATTLGEARLTAFQHATNLLSEVIPSHVEIQIEARMDPLGGSVSSATLGAAGPALLAFDFEGAPHANILYPLALANHLAGKDLAPDDVEIVSIFNSDVDGDTTFGTNRWYYGLDANPPRGHPDFVSVVLHELVHGLGFVSLINPVSGAKINGMDDIFSLFLEHTGATPADFPSMTNAQRAAASIAAPHVHWSGEHVTAKAFSTLSQGISAGKVEMYAPAILEEGSSLSHFSDRLNPHELMLPYYIAPNHNLGLAAQALSDIGWGNESDLQLSVNSQQDSAAVGEAVTIDFTLSNNGPDIANNLVLQINLPTGVSTPQINADGTNCTSISAVLLQCNMTQLAAANHAQIRLSVTPQSVMSLTIAADLNANVVDPQSANNRVLETVTITSENTTSTTNNNDNTDNTSTTDTGSGNTDSNTEGASDNTDSSGGSGSFGFGWTLLIGFLTGVLLWSRKLTATV